MRNKFFLLSVLGLAGFGFSCKRNPVDRLLNPVPAGMVNGIGPNFYIYDDDLKTGGGLGFFPGGENQAIGLEDDTTPARSPNAIVYSWNGQDVTNFSAGGVLEHLFAGFSLTITPDFSTIN